MLEALAQLGQTPGRDARAVVRYDEAQRIVPVLRLHADGERPPGTVTVNDAVFDDRLQKELRHTAFEQLLRNIEIIEQAVVVSRLLQQQIVVHILHVCFKQHLRVAVIDAVAHERGEREQHLRGRFRILADLIAHGLHNVVDKVRVELLFEMLDLHLTPPV